MSTRFWNLDWLSPESGMHEFNQFWKYSRRKFMAIFDPVERLWIAKDSHLPGVSVLAKTQSEAEHHMAILIAVRVLGPTNLHSSS